MPKPRASSPAKRRGGPRTSGRLQQVIDRAVTAEIEKTLRAEQGNVSRSAAALGVSETALWKRIRALGISPDRHRP
jgi:transcriptional regulator of acetoin/glycerol metabolism